MTESPLDDLEDRILTDQDEMQSWRFSISNQMKHVGQANRSLAAFLDEQGVDPVTRSTAELVLEEVVTNVIKYAYDHQEPREIHLAAHRGPAGLVLRVEDDGRAFNPLDAPEPDREKPVEDREAGGLGIHLLRRLADTLEHQRLDGRNILTIRLTENPPSSKDRSAPCL